MPVDERVIIQSAQCGDVTAFNQLVATYQDQAFGVAYRLLGDADSASDAVQESFLKVYRRLHQYRGGSFRAWLLRIVTNTCYDSLRVSKRHVAGRLDTDYLLPERDRRLADHRSSPHDQLMRHELASLLSHAIKQLPPEQRLVLIMCDLEGLEYHEVASATGVALGTVKSRLSRARAKVRCVLSQKGFKPNVPARPVSPVQMAAPTMAASTMAAPTMAASAM